MWYEWVDEKERREAKCGAEGGDIFLEGGFVNHVGFVVEIVDISSLGGESQRRCMSRQMQYTVRSITSGSSSECSRI